MAKKTITIYDVAREAGVSMATVSRVVNGNPNVKPSTRKKVSDVIKKLNYRPNAVARGLASKKTTTVGVIIPDVTNLYFSSIARGIDDIASMYNYNIILTNSDGEPDKETRVLNTVLAQQVDGVIFMGHYLSDDMRKEIDLTDTPIVLAGTIDEQGKLPSIVINYEQASNETTQLFIDKGHKKIALLGLDFESQKQIASNNGYNAALEKAGLESNVFRYPTHIEPNLAKEIADNVQEIGATAAVIEDDRIAITLMNELFERGVNIPEDFEIITSNNSPLVQLARPKMTTINQPLYDLGAVAMRLLTKLMNKEETDELHVELPFDIVENGTTK